MYDAPFKIPFMSIAGLVNSENSSQFAATQQKRVNMPCAEDACIFDEVFSAKCARVQRLLLGSEKWPRDVHRGCNRAFSKLSS